MGAGWQHCALDSSIAILMAYVPGPSLKLVYFRYVKICHRTDLHSSADVGLDCPVPMQFCADTCIQLLHRTSRSRICVVIGKQGYMQSFRG